MPSPLAGEKFMGEIGCSDNLRGPGGPDAEIGKLEKTCGLFLQRAVQHEPRMAGMLASNYGNSSTDPRGQEAQGWTAHHWFCPSRGDIHIRAKGGVLAVPQQDAQMPSCALGTGWCGIEDNISHESSHFPWSQGSGWGSPDTGFSPLNRYIPAELISRMNQ